MNASETKGSDGKLLTAKDVAEILKITPRAAYSLLKTRKIPGKKIGKSWYTHPQDLELTLRDGLVVEREKQLRGTQGVTLVEPTTLNECLRSLETNLAQIKDVFRSTSILVSSKSNGIEGIYPPRRASSETNEVIHRLIREASGEILLCGVSLRQFFHDKPFIAPLWRSLNQKSPPRLRALLIDPLSRAAMARSFAEEPYQNKSGSANQLAWIRQTVLFQDVARSVETIVRFQKQLGAERIDARFYDHTPFAFYMITHQAMMIEPYHFGEGDSIVGGCIGELVPLLCVSGVSNFSKLMGSSFDHIWNGGNPFITTRKLDLVLRDIKRTAPRSRSAT